MKKIDTNTERFASFNFFDPCGHHHFESIDDLFDRFTYARYTNIASEMTPGRKVHLSGGSAEYGTHYTLFLTDGDRYTEIDFGSRLTANKKSAIISAILDFFSAEAIEASETETAEIASETIKASETKTAEINTAETKTSGEIIELETPEMAGQEDIRAFIYREDDEYFLSIYRCDLASGSRIDEWTLRIGKRITATKWWQITGVVADFVSDRLSKKYNSEYKRLSIA